MHVAASTGGPNNSSRILTQGRDGIIKVWPTDRLLSGDRATCAELRTGATGFCQFSVPQNRAGGSSVGPDTLLAPCSEQGHLQLWDLRTGSVGANIQVVPPDRGMVMCCKLLHTSAGQGDASLAVAGREDGSVSVHDLRTLRTLCCTELYKDPVMCCDVTADGRTGVIGSAGNAIHLWSLDIAVGKLESTAQFQLQTPGVACVRFRQDSELFAAGCWDSTVRLYRCRKPAPLAVLQQHEGSANSVAFSPTAGSGSFAVGSKDTQISLWQMYGSAVT